MGGFTTFNAAMVGFVEAVRDDDADKNRLCPPAPYPSASIDWISVFEGGFRVVTPDASGARPGRLAGDLPAQHHPRPERPHGRPPHPGGAR
jgi:hypothetical protein